MIGGSLLAPQIAPKPRWTKLSRASQNGFLYVSSCRRRSVLAECRFCTQAPRRLSLLTLFCAGSKHRNGTVYLFRIPHPSLGFQEHRPQAVDGPSGRLGILAPVNSMVADSGLDRVSWARSHGKKSVFVNVLAAVSESFNTQPQPCSTPAPSTPSPCLMAVRYECAS